MVKLQVVYQKVQESRNSYGVALCLVKDGRVLYPRQPGPALNQDEMDSGYQYGSSHLESDYYEPNEQDMNEPYSDYDKKARTENYKENNVWEYGRMSYGTWDEKELSEGPCEARKTNPKSLRARYWPHKLGCKVLKGLQGCCSAQQSSSHPALPNRPISHKYNLHHQLNKGASAFGSKKPGHHFVTEFEEQKSEKHFGISEDYAKLLTSPTECSDDSAICLRGKSKLQCLKILKVLKSQQFLDVVILQIL